MSELGTLEELPEQYVQSLSKSNLAPLWPALRSFLPHGSPTQLCQPTNWRYNDIRPLLLQAGDLTPIEKAERRVLMLCNPGYDLSDAKATPSIYLGMQLIKPGEVAPNHKHSPSAIRLVVEGDGGFTLVEGEKLPMHPGDLILTPSGLWHEHGHTGTGPVIWLDALDLPLICNLEASYAIEGAPQTISNALDASQAEYRRAGLLPYEALDRAAPAYPLRRFPWADVKAALNDLSHSVPMNQTVQLAYVNPETGTECLPILGFSAIMLRPGEQVTYAKRTCSSVFHVIEGIGSSEIGATNLDWQQHDTLALPTHTQAKLANASSKNPAYLIVIDDAPLHRKLGIYEQFSA